MPARAGWGRVTTGLSGLPVTGKATADALSTITAGTATTIVTAIGGATTTIMTATTIVTATVTEG